MNFIKKFALANATCLIFLTGCIRSVEPEFNHKPIGNDINPTISATASISQDFIFNTDSVGFTKITIRRSEWNKMLNYYDYFYKNENSVIAESYEYEKDGTSWKLNTVGLRLRGNTSRFRPQGKDTVDDETGHRQMNGDWNPEYYSYAANCDDSDYRQSHFKVDFEPFDEDDRKMSGCMKGVALKRSDGLFSKEIFCYNLFHQYGIWTAPRASQTKVYINFIEDVQSNGSVKSDISKCKITKVDFGVYEMFEEVNKQSLKGRMKKKGNNTAANAWLNNDGDLWKCSGGDLTANSNVPSNFGCEDIKINNTNKNKSAWTFVWHNPCYDLKTNKTSVDSASLKFQEFIYQLNNLTNIDSHSPEGIQARKDFYEKWFDVDFFIKTYAVNMLVGMDDDYWGNANNYYLYFDNGTGGSGKCYLIPFDYDNTLGASITDDKVYTNPFEWGNGNNRPLLDRLLEVPEYALKMKNALLEVSSQAPDSPWNKNNCIALWTKWHNQVSPYISTPDIKGWPNVGSTSFDYSGGWKENKHYLTQDFDNIYEQVSLNFRYWLSDTSADVKFDLNGGSLYGEYGIITKEFNGYNSKFDSMIGTPTLSGYEFLGWTKTKDGTDYITSYTGESDFIVYASWANISHFSKLSIYEIKDSSFNGIKIGIANIPNNNYRRSVYVNGQEVGIDSVENPSKYKKIWAFPFTEPGKTYEIYVRYSDKDYNGLGESDPISITAESGEGEFKVLNNPEFYIQNNILKWNREPVIQIGDGNYIRQDNNWSEYYFIEIQSTKKKDDTPTGNHDSWNYQSWNWLGASCNTNFNFKEKVKDEVLNGIRYDLCFRLRYNYNALSYGDFCLTIVDYNDMPKFNIN